MTYVQSPSNPLEILQAICLRFFFFLIWIHPKPIPVHHLRKHPLSNVYNSSYTKKITTPCTTSLLHQEDALVQYLSLSDYNQSYRPWICMWLWTRSLIGGLSEFFTIEQELVKKQKVEASFQKKQNFEQSFWAESLCFELVNSS